MFTLEVEISEFFDEETLEFTTQTQTIELEHSLISLSKWEQKFEKPFLSQKEKTTEELLEYIYFMILTPGVSRDILSHFSQQNLNDVHNYIDAKMTATWFAKETPRSSSSEQITSELIYFWLVNYQIPFDVETWHLNRLFTLIKIFNVKNSKPKKMSKSAIAQQRRALNEQRKSQMNTTG